MLLPEIRREITNTIVLDAFWIGTLLTVTLTGIYTVLGGLRAVVYTDTIQTVILLVSSFFITAIGLNKLGGWGQRRESWGTPDVLLTVLVLGLVIGLYLYFSFWLN